jgi:hypothetical protein
MIGKWLPLCLSVIIFVSDLWQICGFGVHNIGVQRHLNNISVLSYWWSRQEKHRDSHPPAKLLQGDTENATYLRQVTSKIIIRIGLWQVGGFYWDFWE